MGDVAAAAGVSRTTLHSRYPSRQALLVALAHAAMSLVEQAYAGARLDDPSVPAALGRVVDALVPLGPRIEFLTRERSLDEVEEVNERYLALDRPLIELVERGQATGVLRGDVPAWWLVAALAALVYAAWEAIAEGRLAPRDASPLVLSTALDGARA